MNWNNAHQEDEEDQKTLNKKQFEKKNFSKSKEKYKASDWEYRESRKTDAYNRKQKYREW